MIHPTKTTCGVLFLAAIALLLAAPPPAQAQLTGPDLTVMTTLRDTHGFGAVFGWPANTNPCPASGPNWNGVDCDQTPNANHVVSIRLACGTAKLNAPLPDILFQLPILTILEIEHCGLTGSIPASLNNLSGSLTKLVLANNSLSGPLPNFLPQFITLGYFDVRNNQLSGPIPPQRNSTGTNVLLSGNQLNGIPEGGTNGWITFTRSIFANCYTAWQATCYLPNGANTCAPNASTCPATLRMSKVLGDGQRTAQGTAFSSPLQVLVTDLNNLPVSGVTVAFSQPGSTSPVTATTGGNGIASALLTASPGVGGRTVTATVQNSAANVTSAFGVSAGSLSNCANSINVTSTADSGAGTLRQALADVCPGGTVDLTPIANSTITLSPSAASYNYSGRLYLASDVTINGAGVTLSGNGMTRIFFMQGGHITLRNLTLQSGHALGGSSQYGGGGAGMGGAIFQNGGVLTLQNVRFSSNTALGASPDASGSYDGGGFGGGSSGGDLGGLPGPSEGTGGAYGPAAGDGAGGLGRSGPYSPNSNVGSSVRGAWGGFGGGAGGVAQNYRDGAVVTGMEGAGGFGGGGGGVLGSSFSYASMPGPAGWGGSALPRVVQTQDIQVNGGSGAGFGGAIFVRSGTLSASNTTFSGNSATGGTGAQGKGGAIFLYHGAQFNRTSDVGFAVNQATSAGQPGQGSSAAPYTNGATCPGLDTSDICGVVPANTLTVVVNGAGAVTDSTALLNCPSSYCSAQFQTQAVLTAAAAPGGSFLGWSGACTGTQVTCTVPLGAGSATATANFSAPAVTSILDGFNNPYPANSLFPPGTAYLNANFNMPVLHATDPGNYLMLSRADGLDPQTASCSGALAVGDTNVGVGSVTYQATAPYFAQVYFAAAPANTRFKMLVCASNRAGGNSIVAAANPSIGLAGTVASTAFGTHPVMAVTSVTANSNAGAAIAGGASLATAPTAIWTNLTSAPGTATLSASSLFLLSGSIGGSGCASTGTMVPGTVGASGNAVVFTPSSALPGGNYRLVVCATLRGQNGSPLGATLNGFLASAGADFTRDFIVQTTPVISWTNPADIVFGSALGALQLNATANVAGTFVYTPPAGTVLPVGNAQTLSVSFTPSDTVRYRAATAAVQINVRAASGTPANIIVTRTLSRDTATGDIVAAVTLANNGGSEALNVTVTVGRLGSTGTTSTVPVNLGTIAAGGQAVATLRFPGSVGLAGAASVLQVSGTYSNRSFGLTARVSLP